MNSYERDVSRSPGESPSPPKKKQNRLLGPYKERKKEKRKKKTQFMIDKEDHEKAESMASLFSKPQSRSPSPRAEDKIKCAPAPEGTKHTRAYSKKHGALHERVYLPRKDEA